MSVEDVSDDGSSTVIGTGSCLVVGIAGPSGCGKSTLARSLADALTVNDTTERVASHYFTEDPKYFRAPKAPSYRDANPESETPFFTHWDCYVKDLRHCVGKAFKSNEKTTAAFEATSFPTDSNFNGSRPASTPYPPSPSIRTNEIWIVDHFLLLQDERVVELLDLLVFLDPCMDVDGTFAEMLPPASSETMSNYIPSQEVVPESTLPARDVCRERRVQRDPTRTLVEQNYLRQYYNQCVWPAYLHYTHCPARQYQTEHPCQTLQLDAWQCSKEELLSRAVAFVKTK